jgi:hypothetical protein
MRAQGNNYTVFLSLSERAVSSQSLLQQTAGLTTLIRIIQPPICSDFARRSSWRGESTIELYQGHNIYVLSRCFWICIDTCWSWSLPSTAASICRRPVHLLCIIHPYSVYDVPVPQIDGKQEHTWSIAPTQMRERMLSLQKSVRFPTHFSA